MIFIFKLNKLIPFYTSLRDNKLFIIFAQQYLSIEKDGLIYDFCPLDSKGILFDYKKNYFSDLDNFLLFTNKENKVRISIEDFLSIPTVEENIYNIVEKFRPFSSKREITSNDIFNSHFLDLQLNTLFSTLELRNIDFLIDKSLDEYDFDSFIIYSKLKQNFFDLKK